jgi:hypothetical protein
MAIISAPGTSELIILAVILIYWLLVIGTAVSILRRTDISLASRLLWIAILVIAPIIGLILYNFYGQPARKNA